MIHLHTSNNLEHLATQLGQQLYRKKNNILVPHTIIVQSLGMQRWISLQLAKQFGVFLNCRFPFPENFAEEIYRAVIPDYELSQGAQDAAGQRENHPGGDPDALRMAAFRL